MNGLIEALQHRYATKQFINQQQIAPDILSSIEASLRLTPSSFGIQPRKFVFVANPETKEKLLERSPMNPTQIRSCSHLVVLCGLLDVDDAYISSYVEYALEQGGDPERLASYQNMLQQRMTEYREANSMRMYVHNQVYIALGNLLTSCAVLGVDACPMGGFIPHVYNEELGLTEQGYEAVVLCALGQRATDDSAANKPKVRWPHERIIQHIN